MTLEDGYISIPGWRTFQHYDPLKRPPAWVKDHLDQLDREEFLELSFAQRGLLKDLRNLYAKSRGKVRSDPAKLTRRLGQKVRKDSLEALCHAGFLEIVASPELADGYHAASRLASTEPEVETEKEKEPPYPPRSGGLRANGENPRARATAEAKAHGPELRARAWIRNGLAAQVPEAHLEDVLQDEFGPLEPELLAELAAEAKRANRL